MREQRFVAARRARWERLAALAARASRRGVRTMPPAQIEELAFLYRTTTSDLAIAQTRDAAPVVRDYLNRLVAGAHLDATFHERAFVTGARSSA